MTIEVYASAAATTPIETHEWEGTLLEWFDANGWVYSLAENPKSFVTVNGLPLPMQEWSTRHVRHDDSVKMALIQHGDIFSGLGGLLGGILGFVFGFLMPSNKSGGDRQQLQQGQKLETASAKANAPKLNEVVPELAGRFIRYPDYLTQPRRYFTNKRAQMLEFHACIGPGYYEINDDDVKIADTPFNAMAPDAWYQIFEPNADLSSVSTHENWYTSSEVGGTSSGTAGLELSTEPGNRENTQPASYTFDGDSISRSVGTFPTGWGNGTIVNVEYPLQYSVVTVHVPDGDFGYNISEITGYFGHAVPGATVSIGSIGSTITYTVRSSVDQGGGVYALRLENDDGDPVLLTPGTQTMIFGAEISRSVLTYGEQSFTVSPGGFQVGSVPGSRVVFSGGTVYGEWTSEFMAPPGKESTTTLEIDLFFSNGLAFITNEATLQNRTVGIEIQYRNSEGGPWVTVSRSYTDRTRDAIGFTERLNIASMRPLVRVRRVGAASTSTQVVDSVTWYGLKCRLPTVTRYPRWTTMATRVRSGGRLGGQSENQINLIATRKLNVMLPDGTWSTDLRPTKDISAWIRHIAHSIGYTDANIDMPELKRLHDLWTSRGETYSYTVDATTVKNALNSAFGAGMASLTVHDGEIRGVREGVRTQFEQAYSPQNMTKHLSRRFRGHRHSDNDGAEVQYFDADTFESKTIICKLPDSPGVKLETIKLSFAATEAFAWRVGMRRAREQRYQRWDYSFSTELDALNSSYGGYVALFDNVIGHGQSAMLRSITAWPGGAKLTVTEDMRWEEGKIHVVGYRTPEGKMAGPWEATRGSNDREVIANVPKPWPAITLKQELPHIYFGPADQFEYAALITDIKPDGELAVSVKAKNYDVRIYADDDNFPG